jgi:peptidoglycan/LPS O-acetylase OafA/YrhL
MRRAPLGYVRSLDGLRAISILLVMGNHNMGFFSARVAAHLAGWSGVDMFFVISGFLITSLLTDERNRYGTFSFKKFYLRRLLRIAPAYLSFLVGMAVWNGRQFIAALAICLIYLSDYAAAYQWPFFARWFGIGITWSLSVEEQFYLLWPCALWFAPRRPLSLCLLLIGTVICWRGTVVSSGATWERLYFAFDTRFDSILIGCAAALLRQRADSARWLASLGRAPLVCALALFVSAATLPYLGTHRGLFAWCVRLPLHNALVATLVLSLVEAPTSGVGRALASWPMVSIGRLSYSLYLWHDVAFAGVDAISGLLSSHIAMTSWTTKVATEAAKLALSLAMAALSYLLVEKPFLHLKGLVKRSPVASARAEREPAQA